MKITAASHNLLSRLRKRRRGSTLAMVIGTIMVFMVVVIALHHQQSSSRASLLRSEAELRFRESRNFAIRERLLDIDQPWGLQIGASVEDTTPDSNTGIEPNFAKHIFAREAGKWSGLPNLKSDQMAHAHRYLEVTPEGFGGLAGGVRKGTYKMVETEIPGYAAYAPNGNISLGEVAGWQNPEHDEDSDATEAYSGVPALLGAKQDIQVAELKYGEAYSSDGIITIEDGYGVGFQGQLPLPAYESELMNSLAAAGQTLAGSATSGNKTSLISQRLGIGDILDIMFGGNFNPESVLSLRQAWKFPTPMIPGGSLVVPGIVWEVWLHVPFQPDLGFSSQHDPDLSRLDELATEQEETGVLLEEARQKLEAAKQALAEAQAAYAMNPSEANEEAVEEAQQEVADAQAAFNQIEDFLHDSAQEATDIANGKIGGGSSPLPETREEDPEGRDGQWGWNYSKTMAQMVNLVKTVVSGGDLKEVAASISTDVRVVHYGPADEVPGFEWTDDKFISRSTWTVPASRTLRYDGDMEIQGDLWLQRGTVMIVNGNLKVASPVETPSLTDASAPSGRVFFEEGSTLIVKGDFECQGSSHFGSIMVAGEPDEVHPITSALLVDGEVNIPHGTYAAHTIADLIAALNLPGTDAGASTVANLLEQQAPLLSKLAGPFHLRNPYYARYATTFQMVTIPFPPVVVITPVPTPKENLWVFAFRAKTFAYTAALNATLGENLYTQSDWWPFGNGVVPMALNLDLGEAIKASGAAQDLLESAELDPTKIEEEVTNFVQTLEERTISWALKEAVAKLTEEAARILAPGGFGPILDVANAIVDEVREDEDAMDDFYEGFVTDFQEKMGTHGRTLLGDLLEDTDVLDADKYLKEYAGILIYGNTIKIGQDARQVSGMLIAEQDIHSEARLTIGTLLARNGSIHVADFLYYPYFNQASLYVPKDLAGESAIEKAMVREYGAANDSGVAVQVGPPPVTHHITSGGWEL
jgi:hypothetical protein